jgi:hypothetical protein
MRKCVGHKTIEMNILTRSPDRGQRMEFGQGIHVAPRASKVLFWKTEKERVAVMSPRNKREVLFEILGEYGYLDWVVIGPNQPNADAPYIFVILLKDDKPKSQFLIHGSTIPAATT